MTLMSDPRQYSALDQEEEEDAHTSTIELVVADFSVI